MGILSGEFLHDFKERLVVVAGNGKVAGAHVQAPEPLVGDCQVALRLGVVWIESGAVLSDFKTLLIRVTRRGNVARLLAYIAEPFVGSGQEALVVRILRIVFCQFFAHFHETLVGVAGGLGMAQLEFRVA